MTLTLEELPVADALPPGRAGEADDAYPLEMPRRSFFALSGRLLLLVGLFSLAFTTRARRAHADYPNYDEWVNDSDPLGGSACGRFDPDTWYGFDGNNNGYREPGDCMDDVCVGTGDDLMGPGFCTQCSEQSAQSPLGWHFRGARDDYKFGDLSPNACDPDPRAGTRDAWRWAVSSCGQCAPAVFRCHDGYKRYPDDSSELTICQALVGCNHNPYQPC
jgi:hypothetical protein